MESLKNLKAYVNNCLHKNFLQIIVTYIITTGLLFLLMMFLFVSYSSSTLTTLVTTFIVFSLACLILYGLIIVCYSLSINKRTVLGHLFIGFHDLRRQILLILLFFLFIQILSVLILIPYQHFVGDLTEMIKISPAISALNPEDTEAMETIISSNTQPIQIDQRVFIFFGTYFFILILVIMSLAFVPQILYTNSKMKFLDVIKLNFKLMKGRFIKLIIFSIRCSGIFLISLILGLSISIISISITLPSFLISIGSILYMVGGSITFIKIILAISFYYSSITSVDSSNLIEEYSKLDTKQITE